MNGPKEGRMNGPKEGRPNYKRTIVEVVLHLVNLGADLAVGKDATGWTLTTQNESRKIGGPYGGKEMVIFLTGYSRGRQDEALAQLAEGGTEIEEGGGGAH